MANDYISALCSSKVEHLPLREKVAGSNPVIVITVIELFMQASVSKKKEYSLHKTGNEVLKDYKGIK